jgi:LysR family hydrogen peroxide-inducible transcriptional activator
MVVGGAGITLLPQISIATENRARALVTKPFGARGPSRTLALAWRKTAPTVPALKSVAGAIQSVLSKLTR